MIALEFSGTTHQSLSHNVALNQILDRTRQLHSLGNRSLRVSSTTTEYSYKLKSKSSKELGEFSGSTGQGKSSNTATSQSSPRPIYRLQRVAIERGSHKEFIATNITQNNGGKRRQSAELGYGEQLLTRRSLARNQYDVASTNINDGVLHPLQELAVNSRHKALNQNAAFQLIKTTPRCSHDWFLKPAAGHSAGKIPHNATAGSATIQQSTPKD
ncbi:hypothetical protein F511_43356 [Dorcoceras hygrometricum]|uniref:Uncharacterized protein n=1 Tax=Dorcoceras hygrometricum TaxID=472368 RepID=A0A2Z7CAR3_9LAMI|nr:hypothetical protein F511_43356 [Dorcoceras hygrometricum]